MAFGAPSLAYPYGRDQGLFHYVARQWLVEGQLPYRDTFDHEAPGIYVVHAALIAVFGEAMWPIRLVEWLAMIPLGLACARLATPEGEATPRWLLGLAVFVANVFYFGFVSFSATGQREIWCALAIALALHAVLRARFAVVTAAALAGLFAGLAVVMKPASGVLVLVPLAAVVLRARREARARAATAAFLVAAAAPAALTIGYFAKSSALAELVDVLFDLQRSHVARAAKEPSVLDLGFTHHAFEPLATILHVTLGVGVVRGGLFERSSGERLRYALAASLVVTGALAVAVQMTFHESHYGVLLVGEALAALTIMLDLSRRFGPTLARRRASAPASLAALVFALFVLSSWQFRRWGGTYLLTVQWMVGARERDAFADQFRVGKLFYYYKDSEQVGRWLRERKQPGDRLLVRGFQPEIYVTAGMTYGGRFFWDELVTRSRRAYGRDEWRARDAEDFARIRPRWVVALRPRPDMRDWPVPTEHERPEHFTALGYRVVQEMYGYSILERVDP